MTFNQLLPDKPTHLPPALKPPGKGGLQARFPHPGRWDPPPPRGAHRGVSARIYISKRLKRCSVSRRCRDATALVTQCLATPASTGLILRRKAEPSPVAPPGGSRSPPGLGCCCSITRLQRPRAGASLSPLVPSCCCRGDAGNQGGEKSISAAPPHPSGSKICC